MNNNCAMVNWRHLIPVLLISLGGSCAGDALESTGTQGVAEFAQIRISMERERGFGFHPIYQVSVDETGLVSFVGEEYVEVKGVASWTISPSKVDALAREMVAANYMDIMQSQLDDCSVWIPCRPTTKTSLAVDSTNNEASNYGGCGGSDLAEDLERLQSRIDEVLGTDAYVGNGGVTVIALEAQGDAAVRIKSDR